MAMTFPMNLTEEELQLKEKFELLRRVKKAVQQQQSGSQANAAKIEPDQRRNTSKRSIEEAEGATEEAKRLVKSGAMKIAKVAEKQTFKRSKVLDRKLKEGDSNAVYYQPYSANFEDLPPEDESKPAVPNLYSNFVSTGEVGGGSEPCKTISIRGYDLMDDPLRKAFSPFGPISCLWIDDRRKTATIEYSSSEEADKAIKEMNGNMVNGITLRVLKHRPQRRIGEDKGHAWAEIASQAAKTKTIEEMSGGRNVVSYDEDAVF